MPWFVVCILLGQLTLFLDLGSRLFSSYARTFRAFLLRVLPLVLCLAALTAPMELFALGVDTPLVRGLTWGTSVLSLVAFAHFLVPYRFGMRKLRTHECRDTVLPKRVLLREVRLRINGLPEKLDGLSCLVVSDLHCNSPRALSRLKSAIEASVGGGLDLVLILGDLTEKAAMLPRVIEALSGIETRLGSFCVRGNHDLAGGRDRLIESLLAGSPIRLLPSASHMIREAGLTVLGVESPWRASAVPEMDSSDFSIGLTHTPDNIFKLKRAGVALCVAGHTHGGGPGLPIIGALLVPCRYGRFLSRGVFRLGNMLLLVTSGVGYPEERLWRRGEIIRLVLEKGAPNEVCT